MNKQLADAIRQRFYDYTRQKDNRREVYDSILADIDQNADDELQDELIRYLEYCPDATWEEFGTFYYSFFPLEVVSNEEYAEWQKEHQET